MKTDIEFILAIATALSGLVVTAHGVKRKEWGIIYTGAGLIFCGAWILLRTL